MPKEIPYSPVKRKKRARIKLKKTVKLQKKDSLPKDTVLAPTPTPRDNGATFKIKIKRK